MKILYFHQHFNRPSGSGGIRSYKMARALVDAGHQVTMVCGRHAGCDTGLSGPFDKGLRRGMVDGIEVVELDIPYSNNIGLVGRSALFLRFAWRSTRLALGTPCDVIFATTTPLTAGIPGIVARLLKRRPFVFEVRDLWPELPRAMGVIRNPAILWAMSVLEWASYRSADRLVALAGGIADGIARRGVDRARIATIPNGCDLDLFGTPATPWRPEAIPAGNLLALYAGTHGTANGLDAALNAAAVLKRRGRGDISFLLIGGGQRKAELVARAEREGLDNILFLDAVPKAQLPGLMQSSDVGMQLLANVPAFYYGTSPNKFFDYIAAGLPVLNNYPGWLADMIGERQCGFAVPPDDPEAFADALERAADDRAALARMGEASRALAAEKFDREQLAAQFVEWVTNAPSGALPS